MSQSSNLPTNQKPEDYPVVEVVLPEFQIPIRTQSGTVLLSKKELTVVDIYLKHSHNFQHLVKAVRTELGEDYSIANIQRTLQAEHVQTYVVDRLRDMGMATMSKEQWEREAIEFRDGLRPSNRNTAAMHKLLGMAMGFFNTKSETTYNQQINFIEKGDE